MHPIWWIYGFLPGTIPMAWYFAGRDTGGTRVYFLYARCYLAIYALSLVLLLAAAFLGAGGDARGFLVILAALFFCLTWVAGIRHLLHEEDEIVLRLKYFGASKTFQKGVELDAEDRIKLEYGFIPDRLAPPPPKPSAATAKESAIISEISGMLDSQGVPARRGRASVLSARSKAPPPKDRLDLNRSDRDSLATLPGVGVTLALEIVRSRETQGPFQSFDEFCLRLGIKPHVRVAVEPYVEVRTEVPVNPTRETKSKQKSRSARRLD